MTKFKKDDKVRLRNDLKAGCIYDGLTLLDTMITNKNLIVIEEEDDSCKRYRLSNGFIYGSSMLELAEEDKSSLLKSSMLKENTDGRIRIGTPPKEGNLINFSEGEPIKEKEYIVIYEHIEERNHTREIDERKFFDWSLERGETNLKEKIGFLISNGQMVIRIFETTKELTKKVTVDIEELK